MIGLSIVSKPRLKSALTNASQQTITAFTLSLSFNFSHENILEKRGEMAIDEVALVLCPGW